MLYFALCDVMSGSRPQWGRFTNEVAGKHVKKVEVFMKTKRN